MDPEKIGNPSCRPLGPLCRNQGCFQGYFFQIEIKIFSLWEKVFFFSTRGLFLIWKNYPRGKPLCKGETNI